MKSKNYSGSHLLLVLVFLIACFGLHAESWKDKASSPVSNPVFFESPFIKSEVEPVFMWNKIAGPPDFVGGDVFLYAAQLRWAVNDRLAIIATKDGYVDANFDLLPHQSGFGDIAAGLKYAVIDNEEAQFILTPGFELEIPTGNQSVFQGNGKGEWDLFVSAAKGFNNLHAMANVGLRVPNDFSAETVNALYSLQVDYWTCQYFIPFVSLNAFTTLNSANATPFAVEGYDLINFGASQAAGETQVLFGGGFSSKITDRISLGIAFETSLVKPKGLVDKRVTSSLNIGF